MVGAGFVGLGEVQSHSVENFGNGHSAVGRDKWYITIQIMPKLLRNNNQL
jgi:hypothetical protein